MAWTDNHAKAIELATQALADARKTSALRAAALNRQALVQMRTGELRAAVKSATATKAALQSRQKALRAESLFRLAEAKARMKLSAQAIEAATQRGRGAPSGLPRWLTVRRGLPTRFSRRRTLRWRCAGRRATSTVWATRSMR